MSNNEKLSVITKGVEPLLNPQEDLNWKKDCNSNSWFAICHFEADGHLLNFMYHLMIYPLPTGAVMNACFSVTDETTGEYYGEDHFYPFDQVQLSEDNFSIKVPNGEMVGDLNEMKLKAYMENASVEVTMHPVGEVIFNGGAGLFSVCGIQVHQYSIPRMLTEGTMTIGMKTYEIKGGQSWFDRQWQQARRGMSASAGRFRWAWMDINLDSDDYISLWSTEDLQTGEEHAWATVLHADGSQTVATIEALSKNRGDYWVSPISKQKYPTHWLISIPELDTRLEVFASPKEQEIVSKFINKYEAASKVTGTFKGKEANGYCYIELVGDYTK